MITQFHHKKLTWIDIEDPTPEDIAAIIKDFAVHPAWAHELLTPSERAKTESREKAFYAALHYPDHPGANRESRDIEVDYIITENLLITAHYYPIDSFIEMTKHFQVESTLDKGTITNGPELFLMLNNHLYRGLRDELEPLRKEAKQIESEIFLGNELLMVREISHLGRRLLDFKQALRSHRIILKSFFFHTEHMKLKSSIEEDRVFREYFRVESALENIRDLVSELRETNDSLLTSKNNDTTKRFTLMAFFTFPLALVATVLLAPTSPTIFHSHTGFYIVVGILVALFAIMYGYFKVKKWM